MFGDGAGPDASLPTRSPSQACGKARTIAHIPVEIRMLCIQWLWGVTLPICGMDWIMERRVSPHGVHLMIGYDFLAKRTRKHLPPNHNERSENSTRLRQPHYSHYSNGRGCRGHPVMQPPDALRVLSSSPIKHNKPTK